MKTSDVLSKTMLVVTKCLEHTHVIGCYQIPNSSILICSRVILEMHRNIDNYGSYTNEDVVKMGNKIGADIRRDYLGERIPDEDLNVVKPDNLENTAAVALAILHRHGCVINIPNDLRMIMKDFKREKWIMNILPIWDDVDYINILTMTVIPKYVEFYMRRLGLSEINDKVLVSELNL